MEEYALQMKQLLLEKLAKTKCLNYEFQNAQIKIKTVKQIKDSKRHFSETKDFQFLSPAILFSLAMDPLA